MIRCPTCSHENDEFATVCTNCKGFLQNRVPNLNLFETSWGILESPRKTFRTIALAEHKNYSLFLFFGLGIALSFTAFWFFRLGVFFETLLDVIPVALGAGVVVGGVLALLVTAAFHVVARVLGSKRTTRNSFGMLAYSFVPLMLSLVLVLPIELMTFGMYLFTSNPHPAVIKPTSYYILMSLDGLLTGWSIVLAFLGTRVVHGLPGWKSGIAVAVVLSLLTGAFLLGGPPLLSMFWG